MIDRPISAMLSCLAAHFFIPRIYKMLKDAGMVKKNFRGEIVVTSMGLSFIFPCILAIVPTVFTGNMPEPLVFLAVVASLALVGIVDDAVGDTTIKGIRGHMGELVKGRISTGGIKLIVTALLGLLISGYYHKSPLAWVIYSPLFSMSVNFINLMDLRPGRAIKAFLLLATVYIVLGGLQNIWVLIPVMAALPFYLKGEMEEKYMLGDAGANLLGGIAGLYALKSITLAPAAMIMVMLLLIHAVAEHRSLSEFIESIPVLRFIDRLWRAKTDGDTGMDRA